MTALALAAVLTFTPLSGTATVTWYGPGLWGRVTACGQTLHRKTIGVASLHLACGTRVALRWRGHRITVKVIDHTGGVLFDLTRKACVRFARPGRCHTFHDVSWSVAP